MQKFTQQKDLGNQEFKNSTASINPNRKLSQSDINLPVHMLINWKDRD